MEQGTLAAALLISCVGFFVWFYLKNRHENGETVPRMYPLLGTMPELLKNKDRILEWTTEYLAKSPGHTITLKRWGAKPFKLTSNAQNVEYILKTNFDNYPKGEYVCDTLRDLLGDGIFNADAGLWKLQRKLASYEFTTRSLHDYLMDSVAEKIEKRLLPTIASICGRRVDLQDVFMRFAFDSICKLAFGVDPMSLDPSFPTIAFARAFDESTRLSTERFYQVHPLLWKIKRYFNLGSEKHLKEYLAIVNEFAAMVIKNRRKKTGARENQDLLSRFMALEMEDTASSYSDKFLRDIIISFVLAGKDTTSVTLSWFFWLLSKHPKVENKIIQEIVDVAERNHEPGRRMKHFAYSELREMNYLQAALSESLRLYPAVPFDSKGAKGPDVLPDGSRIEKGTRVTYQIYAMGRMESLWGKDCLEFKPERWLSSTGSFVNESPYKFTAFQAGPRICIGKEMAMLQMKSLVAALLPKFKFEMASDTEPRYSINMTLAIKNGLPVIPRARE
ncbi:medium chain fatty acid hydroxylase [Selaginella moellendorffii]|uniref:Medium chain fatty acid hydroxylase n=1 Tax=Selaginella moellendorffii TaxID=88036 RepID=D8S8T6_SELML|nr:cytochrome P450 94A2 [Selaginella moellendorffii]EFJ19087.1 medium chain fatty acid hydroxylase [Selaginella moellendorffii]|eukprot:XP_002979685.1 cytochrome P450 94A2 [Selaginella moellendorffii]